MTTEQVGDIWERVDLAQVRLARADLWQQYGRCLADQVEAQRLRALIQVSLDWEAEVLRQLSLPLEQRDHSAESVWQKVSR